MYVCIYIYISIYIFAEIKNISSDTHSTMQAGE